MNHAGINMEGSLGRQGGDGGENEREEEGSSGEQERRKRCSHSSWSLSMGRVSLCYSIGATIAEVAISRPLRESTASMRGSPRPAPSEENVDRESESNMMKKFHTHSGQNALRGFEE